MCEKLQCSYSLEYNLILTTPFAISIYLTLHHKSEKLKPLFISRALNLIA